MGRNYRFDHSTDLRRRRRQHRRFGDEAIQPWTIGNSIAGVIGGGVGAQIIGGLVGGGTGTDLAGAGGLDIGAIVGQIASGGVGGGVLMVIVGLIKQAMGGGKVA